MIIARHPRQLRDVKLDGLQAKVGAWKHLQAEAEAELDVLSPAAVAHAFKGKLLLCEKLTSP
jgi:hypothetical protein